MADNIDQNDLSSIDALLDEAELDDVPTLDEDLIDEGSLEEVENVDELIDVEDLVDIEETTETAKIEPEQEALPEKEPEITDESANKILDKRAELRQNKSESDSTGEDMKSVKKLIVIFSSVIITLMIIGLVIGVWGAMSTGSVDDETLEKIDRIELGVTEAILKSSESTKAVKALEKKLDGLSFLIKQLDDDILAMTQPNNHKPLIDLSVKANKKEEIKKVKVVSESSLNPELIEKMNKVSSQMSNTQRRVYEVNKRIKSLQSQHKILLRNVKNIEKQMLKNRLAEVRTKAIKESEQKNNDAAKNSEPTGLYQYTSPGGMFQPNSDYYR